MSPSAHFARMRRARESEVSLCGAGALRCSFTGGGREGAESSSATCLFKCEASVTRFSPFLGEPGARRATKAKDKNFHHDDGDVGFFSASLISDESASAVTGRAALGIRGITLVRARSFAKPAAMPQAGTSGASAGDSGVAVGRPRHCGQCHTERARAWAMVSLAQEVCHRWLQRLQVIAAFLELRLEHASQPGERDSWVGVPCSPAVVIVSSRFMRCAS